MYKVYKHAYKLVFYYSIYKNYRCLVLRQKYKVYNIYLIIKVSFFLINNV